MRSKSILELGRRLVVQLDVGNDILASWMAHYIAELIDTAERSPPETKPAAQEACAKAILELWQYRASLPGHLRPLADLEPALRTLASLDTEQTGYRYQQQALHKLSSTSADEDTKQWLEVAIAVDFAAREMVRWAIRSAADRAIQSAQPWVELAAEAGADEGAERHIVRFLREGEEERETGNATDGAAMRNRLAKLEAFVRLANLLIEDLRAQLDVATGEKE